MRSRLGVSSSSSLTRLQSNCYLMLWTSDGLNKVKGSMLMLSSTLSGSYRPQFMTTSASPQRCS